MIGGDLDLRLLVAVAQVGVGEALEARLVERVGGVRDELAEEDLAVGVQRVGDESGAAR